MYQSTGLAQNFSTPSPLTKRREIVAMLRGPMPSPNIFLGTNDFLRLGQWHAPVLAKLPEPSDAQKNDFGMQESGQFSVEVAKTFDAGENWFFYSNTLNNAAWASTLAALVQGAAAPDGTPTAWTVTDASAVAYQNLQPLAAFAVPNDTQTYTIRWRIKKTTGGVSSTFGMNISISGGTQVLAFPRLNVDTGVGSGCTTITDPVDPNFWIASASIQNNNSGNTSLAFQFYPATGPYNAGPADNASATGTHVICWLQLFAGTRDLAYVATTTTPLYNSRGQFAGLAALLKNQPVDLDLLTRVTREDGSTTDFIHERRGIVKSITRKREGITLNVVDVDRAAMDTLWPIKTFVIADWPKLYTDHVNRSVPDGCGIGEKIPCAYVDNTAAAYKYAVCQYPAGGVAPTVLTVYRGKASGQGQIVPATEYAVSTSTVAGTNYVLLTFVRDQVDFDNQKFVIEADVSSPLSRLAADEIARILQAIGLSIDNADFADAAIYHAAINARVDAWYTKQIKVASIIAALTEVARGWLSQTIGGAYSLFIDRPRAPQRVLWDDSDEVQVDERSEPEFAKTMTLRYRPRPWDSRTPWSGDLSRATAGANGEKVFQNEYVRDHTVADSLLCYLTLKEQRAAIRATLYGVQLQPGELIAINSPLVFDGWKSLAANSINRAADAAQINALEYTEADYVYTPGTLPADATNVYSPDYSYTPPVAPTALAVISQGITVDVDGKGLAYALIRAVPPAANWAKLMAQIRNTGSNEIYQAQLILSGGNYEAVIPNLRPNVAHQVIAWAVNANAIDGVTAAAVAFTSATYTAAPGAPTGLSVIQVAADQIELRWTPPAGGALIDYYIPYFSFNGGSYTALKAVSAEKTQMVITAFGSSHTFKLKTVDKFGNQSADSSTAAITPAPYLVDGYISPLGVSTPSLAAEAAARAKIKLVASSSTITVNAGTIGTFPISAWAIGATLGSADYADFVLTPGSGSLLFSHGVKNIHATLARDCTLDHYYIDT